MLGEKRGELLFAEVAEVELDGAVLIAPLSLADDVGVLAVRAEENWFGLMHTFHG